MKRPFVRFLSVLALLCVLVPAVPARAEYRALTVGDKGQDVVALKKRLYELGYFKTKSFGDTFTKDTAGKIRCFVSKYGEDGDIATPEVQEWLYAADARPESYVPMTGPASVGPTVEPELPELATDGTLADKSAAPFLYKNAEAGLWLYISGTLSVEIKRFEDRVSNLMWLETRVRLSGGNRIRTIFSDEQMTAKRFDKPLNIVKKHPGVILAFSDDFFGWRKDAKDIQGIIVREGRVYSDVTRTTRKFPPLDVIAALPDGSLRTFAPDAHTAQEYLDMGVENTWAFGPILVQNGEAFRDTDVEDGNTRQPRQGMGMLAPNDYLFLTVMGRRKDSEGCTIQWLQNRFLGYGVQEAINLDGGNSTMLVFDGEMLNKVKTVSESSLRSMVSMIAFTD